VRFDNTEIDLTTIKYIKIYKTEADYLRDYPPAVQAPEPEPAPEPFVPELPAPNSVPSQETVGYAKVFSSKSGITATVTLTENDVVVTAGLNKSGSVNSEATAAAVAEAAKISVSPPMTKRNFSL
jgi:hypothetical protein